MIRQVIEIDEEKCNGCGICANACHEGAIAIINGKAKLVRDGFCDGFGDCLPACPTGAISFVEREAAEYDESAVMENKRRMEMEQLQNAAQHQAEANAHVHGSGCPGTAARSFDRESVPMAEADIAAPVVSQLTNWPVQIKLAPTHAPYFDSANLLIAADCCAYSYASFHKDFMRNKVTLIGCPKLDSIDYSEKLAQIIRDNDIKSVTITRMEVPCCGGLERMATEALKASGKFIPWQVVTFSLDGRILD